MPDHIFLTSLRVKYLLDEYVVREFRRQVPSGFSLNPYPLPSKFFWYFSLACSALN